MTPSAEEIALECNRTLRLDDFPDYGPMGAQRIGESPVRGIACAVSVNTDVISKAYIADCNLLIVHHGMFWNNESRLSEHWLKRVELLEQLDMTLLAYHLALDAHPMMGNNILAARTLGLSGLTPWLDIGWQGEYQEAMPVLDFDTKVHKHFGVPPTVFFFHPSEKVQKVAVIVGGAAHYVIQAKRDGFDTFFTGELSEPSIHLAKDLEMNLIGAGHDRTERAGVQKLARDVSRKFKLPYQFIDESNPI